MKDVSHEAKIEALRLEVQELKTELVLCKASGIRSSGTQGRCAEAQGV